jgi:hypothetical protein
MEHQRPATAAPPDSTIINPLSSILDLRPSALPALRHYQGYVVVLLARAELPNIIDN